MTRPLADSAVLAAALHARDLTPIAAPVIAVRPLALQPHSPVAAVLITSGNAIPALETLTALPLLAVGDATASRARQAGFAQVASAGGDATDLLALVRQRCPPGAALLLATGWGQGHALAAALREAGYRVHRRVVYAAAPVPRFPPAAQAAILGNALRAAIFLSAETARAFVRLIPPALHPALAEVDALAIGQSTAEQLTLLPWRRVRVSVVPTLDQVLALL